MVADGPGPVAGTPPVAPPGGGLRGRYAPVSTGAGSMRNMRTRALRVTVGAYDKDAWHTSIVQDTYDRGVLINSECLDMRWGTLASVRSHVQRALDVLITDEIERVQTAPASGETRAG